MEGHMGSPNPFSLEGKAALITGGGRGIGAGIAHSFVAAGASVALVSRTAAQVDAVAAEINGAGGKAVAIPSDITDLSNLDGVVERVANELGGIDTVVNCAGGGDMWRSFLDNTAEEMEEAFHFNVTVPFQLVQKALPHLLERPGSSVINIVSGAIALPARGHLSYDASKGGLLYATRSMSAALGPRVRVNGINPGIIHTEAMEAVVASREGLLETLNQRVRLGRLGAPEDIGSTAVFLASPAASYITGVLIDVDGGAVPEGVSQFPDL
jgi:7-alpha-hydroxysteroid dehydrogenase